MAMVNANFVLSGTCLLGRSTIEILVKKAVNASLNPTPFTPAS